MAFKSDGFSYEMPFRPNFEARAAWGYTAGVAASAACSLVAPIPTSAFLWMGAFCGSLALWCWFGAYKAWKRLHSLKGWPLTFATVEDMKKKAKDPRHKGEQYLGRGFIWENRHAQAAFEITKNDYYTTFISNDGCARNFGMGWLHGIEIEEKEIWQLLAHTAGHTLITGVPGSGKTRLFDMLITQAVSRGEGVIIIDPKGDVELRNNALRACRANGIEHRFIWFHPAHPDESVALDPLKNFNRSTELASRITSLMPTGGASATFSAFAWNVLSSIADAMIMCGIKPSLIKLRSYAENGVEELLTRTIIKHCETVSLRGGRELLTELITSIEKVDKINQGLKDREEDKQKGKVKSVQLPTARAKAMAAADFYKQNLKDKWPSRKIGGLLSIFEHDQAHYSKMITNLLPLLGMLTNGKMGELLSPDDFPNTRPKFDTGAIINEQFVFWLGLDSLSDAEVGQRVGSLILSDLASVAGARYNFVEPEKMRPINIFVDEAAEVLNEPFIQLLNKARGAQMRLYVATQTIADFAAKMGSVDKANQILGNINNKFALRTTDLSTQKYLSEHMPKTTIHYVQRGQGVGGSLDKPLMHTGHLTESLMEKEVPLFAPQFYALLPNLEYLAFISGGTTIKGRIPIISENKAKTERKRKRIERVLRDIEKERNQPVNPAVSAAATKESLPIVEVKGLDKEEVEDGIQTPIAS